MLQSQLLEGLSNLCHSLCVAVAYAVLAVVIMALWHYQQPLAFQISKPLTGIEAECILSQETAPSLWNEVRCKV